jgi:GTPase SAR1 family protein
MSVETYDHLLKLLLVGDSNVGKTSLLLSFTSDSFKENVRNTVGVDLKVKIIKHGSTGKTLKLTIWVSRIAALFSSRRLRRLD